MSFSSEVKEELEKKIDTARHCQIAEFAAYMGFLGNIRRNSGGEMNIELSTENEGVINKFKILLNKIFNITENEIKEITDSNKDKVTMIRIVNQESVANILMTLKWCDEQFTMV